jgi:LysR family transcriptional repressor of citA
MNFELLETFVTLAKENNFSLTAERLFVSQSTVTKRIAELEKSLNTALFSRSNKHVALTPEGSIFLHYATRILELQTASIEKIHALVHYQKHLRIGTTNSLYECHVFDKIQTFYSHPDHAVKIVIGHSGDLLTGLQDGALDVIFSFIPLNKAGYDCLPFKQDQMVLATGYDTVLYEKGIKKDELTNIDYLMCNFALQEVGQFVRELFPLHYPFKFEIDNSTKLIPYLKKGNRYSFLPKEMIEEHLGSRELRIIPLLDFKTPMIQSYVIGSQAAKALWAGIL